MEANLSTKIYSNNKKRSNDLHWFDINCKKAKVEMYIKTIRESKQKRDQYLLNTLFGSKKFCEQFEAIDCLAFLVDPTDIDAAIQSLPDKKAAGFDSINGLI